MAVHLSFVYKSIKIVDLGEWVGQTYLVYLVLLSISKKKKVDHKILPLIVAQILYDE
jgi:hypothetical protein